MTSSRRRRSPRARLAVPLLLLAVGCAHVAPRPEPSVSGRDRQEAEPTPGAATAGTRPPPPAPSAGTVAPSAPVPLDPSEEITPAELASIPEPVETGHDAGGRTAPTGGPEIGAKAAPEPQEARSADPRLPTSAGALWRVQVLATPDRALADRIAAQAAERLGTIARVDVESSLYKVRLGGFATEAEAQNLRERAIEMGYPGAFRVKNAGPATD